MKPKRIYSFGIAWFPCGSTASCLSVFSSVTYLTYIPFTLIKGAEAAFSVTHRPSVRLSVRLSVCPSVRQSVRPPTVRPSACTRPLIFSKQECATIYWWHDMDDSKIRTGKIHPRLRCTARLWPQATATCGPLGELVIADCQKTKHIRWWNVSDDMCRMGRWSFWSWFDVNRSTFDEDMRENDFTFSFPVSDLRFDL